MYMNRGTVLYVQCVPLHTALYVWVTRDRSITESTNIRKRMSNVFVELTDGVFFYQVPGRMLYPVQVPGMPVICSAYVGIFVSLVPVPGTYDVVETPLGASR